jgi:hypothetical protein
VPVSRPLIALAGLRGGLHGWDTDVKRFGGRRRGRRSFSELPRRDPPPSRKREALRPSPFPQVLYGKGILSDDDVVNAIEEGYKRAKATNPRHADVIVLRHGTPHVQAGRMSLVLPRGLLRVGHRWTVEAR